MIIDTKVSKIEIDSYRKEINKYIKKNLGRYVPLKENSKEGRVNSEYIIKIRKGDPSINYNEEGILYRGVLGKTILKSDIIVLISSLLEYLFVKKGFISIHSSVVYKNSTGVALVGKPKVGKTSLAIRLCKKHDFKYACNERSVVDESSNVVSGVRKIELKKRFIYEEYGVNKYSGSDWSETVLLDPIEIGIGGTKGLPVRVKNIVFPFLRDNDLKIDNFSDRHSFFKIYKNSLYFDKMFKPVLYGMKREVPSFHKIDNQKRRFNIIDSINSKCKSTFASGRRCEVAEFIAKSLS